MAKGFTVIHIEPKTMRDHNVTTTIRLSAKVKISPLITIGLWIARVGLAIAGVKTDTVTEDNEDD